MSNVYLIPGCPLLEETSTDTGLLGPSIWTESAATGTPGDASGAIQGVTVSAVSGQGSGQAAISATIDEVVVQAISGSASGAASVSSAIPSVVVIEIESIATGSGYIETPVDDVTIEPVQGSANGGAGVIAEGAIAAVTISAIAGVASGAASVLAALTTILVNPVQGSALPSSVGEASGDIDSIDVTGVSGSAQGSAIALSNVDGVILSSVEATATGQAQISPSLGEITVTPISGQAEEGGVIGEAFGALTESFIYPITGDSIGYGAISVPIPGVLVGPVEGRAVNVLIIPPITCEAYTELAYTVTSSVMLKTTAVTSLEKT